MKTFWKTLGFAAAVSTLAVGQRSTPGEQISQQLREQIREQARQATGQAAKVYAQQIQDLALQVAAPPAPPVPPVPDIGINFDGGDGYRSGQSALDRRQYEQAVTRFDRVINAKGNRADGAMYWKAYALNKLGRRDQSLAALADLEKQFPQSRWLNDARALAAEVRSSSGQPASPESQADEDMKLLAINGLINQEPDRAIPLLEKVLGDSKNPPNLKSRALYVLAQSKAPRARDIVMQYAKGGSNPDLQARAIEYLGTFRSAESMQALTEIYASSKEAVVKREVINALARQGAAAQLVDLARKETDIELKRDIVRQLSRMKNKEASDYLVELLSK
jgi:tetratricopeptide (TPR) repeat protein